MREGGGELVVAIMVIGSAGEPESLNILGKSGFCGGFESIDGLECVSHTESLGTVLVPIDVSSPEGSFG